MRKIPLAALLLGLSIPAYGQTAQDSTPRGARRFVIESTGTYTSGIPRLGAFLGDEGRSAALLGDEMGAMDVWTGSFRVVRNFRLFFRIQGAAEFIEGNTIARIVTVRPEGQTIVYSHPQFTVRAHMLVPLTQAGAIILLDAENSVPIDIAVRIQADSGSVFTWEEDAHRFLVSRGSVRAYTGMVGSPFATRASRVASDLVFTLRIPPSTASSDFIPIVIAGGAATRDSVAVLYARLAANAQRYWDEKAAHYRRVRGDFVSIETPDARLNQALEWAKVNLDQQLVCNADANCGLGAGISRATARSYDFSGDAAIGTLAMDATGQFDVVRQGLLFFATNHSWFHADRTPSWILACYEYWLASDDDGFLREMWPGLISAFRLAASTMPVRDGYRSAIWAAAVEGMQRMARAQKGNTTLTKTMELGALAQMQLNDALKHEPFTVRSAPAIAFGLVDAEHAEEILKEVGSAGITADWGTRTRSRYDTLYDPLDRQTGAVSLAASGLTALAHYHQHRAWAGQDLVRAIARATFDFARGRTPDVMSGAFYQVLDGGLPQQFLATAMFVLPLVRGMVGWEADAPTRSAALEPHMPADWTGMKVTDLRVGRDRLDAVISREGGVYTVNVRRATIGPPIGLRVAPALPLGAHVDRIVVNDRDVPAQVEETAHDIHGVAEIVLERDAQIEFHYIGGMELVTPLDRVEIGESSHDLKVLDFRRDARDYIVSVEGAAGETYIVQLRTEVRTRAVQGADSFEQAADRLTIRVTMPPGRGFLRKALRIRS